MKRSIMVWLAPVALFLAFASSAPSVVEASHPPYPQPLLYCSDVNGDGAVSVGDLTKVVGKFGTNDPNATANATYHPLYDLTTPPGSGSSGAVAVNDIVVAVSDFGQMCPALDTQIARATLDVIDPMYHPPMGMPDFPGDAGLLTENATLLASKGYILASLDVPGQGKHYINESYFTDNLYYETQPEGLVYNGGKLSAQLYYIEGDDTAADGDPDEGGVGWGPEPPPIEQVNIDAFCTPNLPNTTCSWAGPYDGWHLHLNLCTLGIGTPDVMNWIAPSDAACANLLANGIDNPPIHPAPFGGTYRWDPRIGWMGHMWNHMLNANVNNTDILGNGRFADCFPDTQHWTGFNCPQ